MQYRYFKYQVMFFGFFNILNSFYKYIDKILIKKLDIFFIIYLDNIFIYIQNFGQLYIESYILDFWTAIKIGLFYQFKEILILLKWDLVFKLYSFNPKN